MSATPEKATAPRIWQDVRHPATHRLIGRYCPQENLLEVVDRTKRAVIKLPETKPQQQ